MFERTRAAIRAFFAPHQADEAKFSGVGPIVATGRTGVAAHSPWSSDKLASEGYAANVISYLCVRLVADAFASLPLLAFQGEREVPGHPVVRLLARPNPLRGQDRWLQELAVWHLIAGNSFIEAVRAARRGPPRELYNLNPRRMAIIPGPAGLPAAYRFEAQGRRRDYPLDPVTGYGDVLHLREPNPLEKGEEYGFSPTQAAARWIDLDNSGADRRIQHSTGSDPDVAFLFQDVVDQNQLDIANAKLRQRWEDTRRQQMPFAMGGNASVVKLGQSLREMQWTEGMDAAARRICAAWNVPHVLVVPGESTYANREMAHLELWEHTVLPFAKLMLGDIVPWFRFLYGDDRLDLRIDEDGISALEPRRASIRETSLLAFEKGMLSLNEARLVWGYEPALESDDPAEEPAALRNARQASMLAEAQQEALRSPQEQQAVRPGLDDSEDEEEEERAETRAKQPWQDQGRVPAGEEGAGRFIANSLSEAAFARWLRTGKKGQPPTAIECKDEADDLAGQLDDGALIDEMLPVVRQILVDHGVRVFMDLGVEISFDVSDPDVAKFLRDFGGDRIRDLVGTTTRARLGAALAEAMEQGAGFSEIVQAVRNVFAQASQDRAEMIAITETTRAVGAGTQIAMERAGVERKRWISSRDAFVRPSHKALDGQTVPADQPFRGGGIEGPHPGAMSGGAAANARCRCFAQPLPDEKADEATNTEEKRTALWKSAMEEQDAYVAQLAEAVRRGFGAQERSMVVAAYRRFGNV